MSYSDPQVDITKYPFDESICGITVTPWIYPEDSVKLVAADLPFRMTNLMTHSQFWIHPHDVILNRSSYAGDVYRFLSFRLRLTRRPSYLVMTLLVPVTLLAILCIVTFLLPPEVPEKTSMAITILLAYTVYLSIVDKELPETSEQMSHMSQ
ncbi:Neuronal acetylcholine receptor subunit alpha-9 [Bulinus truncatus]|nr:Neuronal acetylcholine receptor subunit alpha-9 [Bulinus truncatus]